MTPKEQIAFVKAFSKNVASCPEHLVIDFIERLENGEDFDYSIEHIPIMDALGMWNDAIKWKLEVTK